MNGRTCANSTGRAMIGGMRKGLLEPEVKAYSLETSRERSGEE